MDISIEQLTERALQLPAVSRARLAEQLVESLADATSDETRRLWANEAIRRRDEMRREPTKAIPGEQVLAEARRVVGR